MSMPSQSANFFAGSPGKLQKPASTFTDARRFTVELKVPLHELSDAVDRADESAIWRLYRQCGDPHLFLDWLGNLVCNTVSRVCHPRDPVRSVEMMHTLFLVPVLLPPMALRNAASPQEALKVAMAIRQELETWWGAGSSITLHCNLVRYRDICLWGPSGLHRLVTSLAGQPALNGAPLPVSPSTDDEMPELTFVVGCAHHCLVYAEVPEAHAQNDGRLHEVLAAYLGFMTNRSPESIQIGRPELLCDAIRNGLASWLSAMIGELNVSRWQISPELEDISRLKLYSSRDHQEIAIPIRMHQVGLHGLDLLVAQLSEIAGSCVSEGSRH